MPLQRFDLAAPLTPQEIAHDTVRRLGQMTSCFAAGVLLVQSWQGELILLRSRPVDDLFLQALQRRLLHSYRLCVGPALTVPEIEVSVYGSGVPGPYEAPRSLLTMPLLHCGRVIGVIGIASVFAGVFGGEHLCTMAALATEAAEALARALSAAGWNAPGDNGFGVSSSAAPGATDRDPDSTGASADATSDSPEAIVPSPEGPAPSKEWGTVLSPDPLHDRVSRYLESILDLTRDWQDRGDGELSDLLRQDLEVISQNALRAHELLAH
jgi:hypothetical protein